MKWYSYSYSILVALIEYEHLSQFLGKKSIPSRVERLCVVNQLSDPHPIGKISLLGKITCSPNGLTHLQPRAERSGVAAKRRPGYRITIARSPERAKHSQLRSNRSFMFCPFRAKSIIGWHTPGRRFAVSPRRSAPGCHCVSPLGYKSITQASHRLSSYRAGRVCLSLCPFGRFGRCLAPKVGSVGAWHLMPLGFSGLWRSKTSHTMPTERFRAIYEQSFAICLME